MYQSLTLNDCAVVAVFVAGITGWYAAENSTS
jgi:hypothetical protein